DSVFSLYKMQHLLIIHYQLRFYSRILRGTSRARKEAVLTPSTFARFPLPDGRGSFSDRAKSTTLNRQRIFAWLLIALLSLFLAAPTFAKETSSHTEKVTFTSQLMSSSVSLNPSGI